MPSKITGVKKMIKKFLNKINNFISEELEKISENFNGQLNTLAKERNEILEKNKELLDDLNEKYNELRKNAILLSNDGNGIFLNQNHPNGIFFETIPDMKRGLDTELVNMLKEVNTLLDNPLISDSEKDHLAGKKNRIVDELKKELLNKLIGISDD